MDGSLAGHSLLGCKAMDTTRRLSTKDKTLYFLYGNNYIFFTNSWYVGLLWLDCKAMYAGTVICIVSGTMHNVDLKSE